ncbi:ROK family protein [Melissospora conviva]|uniref:ROK family protein n=1 Tax=Melissospora conviva TaxID=3388432 RepID=UPI003C26A491
MTSEVIVAIDVGGTTMKCALVHPHGRMLHTERHPTRPERGADAVTRDIGDIAAALAEKARTDGLTPIAAGIVVPGVVDEANGIAVWSANVGFRNVPLGRLLNERLGVPTTIGHDVRAGGLAEARIGAARLSSHVLFLAIGTGIAATHVMSGRAIVGANGTAGELGHIVVRPGGPRCSCSRHGCLEAVASASAVGRHYSERAGRTATAADVARLARSGDRLACQIWRETVDALADGLATAQSMLDVETMVVGGGLALAGQQLLEPLRAGLHHRLTFHKEPLVVPAALGDAAGCLGAALMARRALETRR